MNWASILGALHKHNPDLWASIELAGAALHTPIGLNDDSWLELHPDLVEDERRELFRLAQDLGAAFHVTSSSCGWSRTR